MLRGIAEGTGDPLEGEGGLSSPRTSATSASAGGPAQSASTLMLREEQLRIETELVQAGEAVLCKEVVQEEQAIEVPVRHEEIVIEHRPVAPRPASGPIGHNPTIAVSVHEEAVRLEKRPIVTEEVTISTRTAEDVARIAAPLRREEVVVETEGAVRITGDVELDSPPDGKPR